jgi:Xaa-Pro dipeptidase
VGMESAQISTIEIPADEFPARRARAIDAARARGLDGLLVWSRGGTAMDYHGDVLYLTNYASPTPLLQPTTIWNGRGQSVLILPVDDDPVLIVDRPDYPRDRVHVTDVRFTRHIPRSVAGVLTEKGLDRGRLGLVARETMLLAGYRTLVGELGHDADFQAADDILERMRMLKSVHEVAALEHAGRVGAGWMRTTMEAIAPGKTEADFVGEGLHFLAKNGGYPYDVAVGSGPHSEHYFGQRSGTRLWEVGRPVEDGDLVHIDVWGPIADYYTDFSRSTVVGRKPTDGQRDVLEAARSLVKHIVDEVRPGVIINDLYERGVLWLVDNGFGPDAATEEQRRNSIRNIAPHFGHGVGLGVEFPWIIEGETTALEANMVMAVEFFLVQDGVGGAKYEHNVLVTPNGHGILDGDCPEKWWD